jgi:hypothetical protein
MSSVNVTGLMVSVQNQFGAKALNEMSPGRHVSALNNMNQQQEQPQRGGGGGVAPLRDVQTKTLASPKMSKVRPLSPYMNNRGADSPKVVASGQHLLKYAINRKDPSELVKS